MGWIFAAAVLGFLVIALLTVREVFFQLGRILVGI